MVWNSADLVGSVKETASTGGGILLYIVLGIVVLIFLGIIFAMFYFKKRSNLKVEFKLPRSDGKLVNAEWGTGYYDSKKGVVFVRRPNMSRFSKGIPIRIFDIRRYIQGDDVLTVLQVGPEDFRPVLNDSWTEHVVTFKDDKTGEVHEIKESVLNIKVDSGLNKAWKSAWDAAAKKAYSITSLIQQFQTPIAIGIVIICCFVGFAILWSKIPTH